MQRVYIYNNYAKTGQVYKLADGSHTYSIRDRLGSNKINLTIKYSTLFST